MRISYWSSDVCSSDLDAVGRLHPLPATSGAPADFTPNGWSMAPDGAFLIANLGESGVVWRLRPDGRCEPLLLEVDGVRLPTVNFVHRAGEGGLWISEIGRASCRVRVLQTV